MSENVSDLFVCKMIFNADRKVYTTLRKFIRKDLRRVTGTKPFAGVTVKLEKPRKIYVLNGTQTGNSKSIKSRLNAAAVLAGQRKFIFRLRDSLPPANLNKQKSTSGVKI